MLRKVRGILVVFLMVGLLSAIDSPDTTMTLPENLGIGFGFLIANPQGEFDENVENLGLGFIFNTDWSFNHSPFSVGIELGGATYGKLERNIPFNYFTDLVNVEEKTTSDILLINLFGRSGFMAGKLNIYTKAFTGFQLLNTTTTIRSEQWITDDDETDEIASSNVFEDFTYNYGLGVGFRFPILKINRLPNGDSGKPLQIQVELNWSKGGEAEYLNASKEGSIIFSDPEDGPVTTSYHPDKSKTDLFKIQIGIGI